MKRSVFLLCCAAWLLLTPACGWLLDTGREVVAEVGGEQIRVSDLQSRIRSMDFQARTKAADRNAKVRVTTRRDILAEMVVDRLMVLEAESRGIDVTEEEILHSLGDSEETHDEAADEIAGGGSHGHENEQERSTWELEDARNRLLVERLLEEELSEDILRAFYDEHSDDFKLESPIVNYEMMSVAPGNEAIVDTVYRLMITKGMPMRPAYESIAKPDDGVSIGITPTMPLSQLPLSLRKNVEGLAKREVTRPFYFGSGEKKQYAIARRVRNIKKTPYEVGGREEVYERLRLALIERLSGKYEVSIYDDKIDYPIEH